MKIVQDVNLKTMELHESWINGNRKYVIEQILNLDKIRGLIVCAYLYDLLDNDKDLFGRMLESRM